MPTEARRGHGSCELPNVSAGNEICVPWKSNVHSSVLRNLLSPSVSILVFLGHKIYIGDIFFNKTVLAV